jgi:hypothetical protein
MDPDRAVIDVWLADATRPGWRGLGGSDGAHSDGLSAIGLALSAAAAGGSEPSFARNLSHSGRLVVFAAARTSCVTHLGVDVEMRRDLPRPAAFAGRVLTDAEADGARDLVAAWTVKEAALKAVGVGLAGDPRSWRFEGLLSTHPRLLAAPDPWGPPIRWAFLRTDIEGPAALALAVRLDRVRAVDVIVRSADDPVQAAQSDREPLLRLTWSPLGCPTTS